jgi:prephenate dehydrogenase
VFEDIAPVLRPGAIVTDTASVKAPIMAAASITLPENVHFIGGHPMAGSDRSGPDAASAELFVDEKGAGRAYCLVASPTAAEQAVSTMVGVVEMVGGKPVFIDAHEHDALVAGISHMPIMLSVALFMMARNSKAWGDLSPLAGPAFRDLTRLTKGSPEMALDIFGSNRENVVHWLDRFSEELTRLRGLLSGDERALHEELLRAQMEREVFDERTGRPESELPEIRPLAATDQLISLMVGERMVRRSQEMTELTRRDPVEQRLTTRQRERQWAEDPGEAEA